MIKIIVERYGRILFAENVIVEDYSPLGCKFVIQ
jgi:hypothetical protein